MPSIFILRSLTNLRMGISLKCKGFRKANSRLVTCCTENERAFQRTTMTIRDHLFVFLWLAMACGLGSEVSAQGRSVRDSVLFSPSYSGARRCRKQRGRFGFAVWYRRPRWGGCTCQDSSELVFRRPSQLRIRHGVEGIGGIVKFAHAHGSID